MIDQAVVVITGAASGIGWATAQRFAQSGHRVAIVDLDGEQASSRARQLGDSHLGLAADVASEADIDAIAAAVFSSTGRIDVLVNNAGIADTHLPTLQQNPMHFRKVLDVHLTGCFLASRAIVGRANGPLAIVNISSIAGVVGLPRRNAYGAAKAGIVSMTKSMACEWASRGVRVNAVAPGYVETDLVRKLIAAGRMDRATISRRVPLGMLGQPGDIAEAIHFLASPAARYITGATLSVDGGWTAFGDFGDASADDA